MGYPDLNGADPVFRIGSVKKFNALIVFQFGFQFISQNPVSCSMNKDNFQKMAGNGAVQAFSEIILLEFKDLTFFHVRRIIYQFMDVKVNFCFPGPGVKFHDQVGVSLQRRDISYFVVNYRFFFFREVIRKRKYFDNNTFGLDDRVEVVTALFEKPSSFDGEFRVE